MWTWFLVPVTRGREHRAEDDMDTPRIFLLQLDLTDAERRVLADAASRSGERFVDYVRDAALAAAGRSTTDVDPRPRIRLA